MNLKPWVRANNFEVIPNVLLYVKNLNAKSNLSDLLHLQNTFTVQHFLTSFTPMLGTRPASLHSGLSVQLSPWPQPSPSAPWGSVLIRKNPPKMEVPSCYCSVKNLKGFRITFKNLAKACSALWSSLSPLWPHLLPQPCYSPPSSHTGLLVLLRTLQTHSFLRAFALAIYLPWNILLDTQLTCSFSLDFDSNITLPERSPRPPLLKNTFPQPCHSTLPNLLYFPSKHLWRWCIIYLFVYILSCVIRI